MSRAERERLLKGSPSRTAIRALRSVLRAVTRSPNEASATSLPVSCADVAVASGWQLEPPNPAREYCVTLRTLIGAPPGDQPLRAI